MHRCPKCEKELGLNDQRGVVDHPKAKRLKSLTLPVTWCWLGILALVFGVLLLLPADKSFLPGRGFGWMIAFLPLIPGFILHIASWEYPMMRVWNCSSCGHRSEQELK